VHLYELTTLGLEPPVARVQAWTLGCFQRRSITFFDGREEGRTQVVWLQSHGATADFRRPPGTPSLADRRDLLALGPAELRLLARVEGGFARSRHDGALMHWTDWVSFQTHARWPEPGRLARVGGCLIELAPSGAYVEDWRLQPGVDGPLIGLHLLEERDARTGEVLHAGGGLIVCGRHAACVRGRPAPLPEGTRLEQTLAAAAGDAAALARIFSFDAAYGVAAAGSDDYRVTLSTLPWREGEPVLSLEGFSYDAASGHVLQRAEQAGRSVERRFSVDTVQREPGIVATTDASADARRWFEQESESLLATVP
jgi:hypothetical protein